MSEFLTPERSMHCRTQGKLLFLILYFWVAHSLLAVSGLRLLVLSGAGMTSSIGHRPVLSGIVATWMAQAVTVVVGFLMPRLINDSIGSIELGIWDLCWSLLIFFSTSHFGVGTALAHFRVGRALNDPDAQPSDVLRTAATLQFGLALIAGAAFFGLLCLAHRVLNGSGEPVPA
ncbi:MAG: hypothetical protein ACKOZX_06570, partial [Gammaproteobacteria bacterium]